MCCIGQIWVSYSLLKKFCTTAAVYEHYYLIQGPRNVFESGGLKVINNQVYIKSGRVQLPKSHACIIDLCFLAREIRAQY